MGRKQCGKKRNCALRTIFPFPTVFFLKDLYFRHVKHGLVLGRINIENMLELNRYQPGKF